MRYEILEYLPPYGPMPVAIARSGTPYYSAGFPVRFFKSDGTDWVGNFAPGSSRFNTVLPLRDSENVLVIAGGTCYIMHPDNTSPIKIFGEYYDGAFPLEDGRIILQGTSRFSIMDPDGSYWETGRISYWKFVDVAVNGHIITGQAISFDAPYEDEFVPFTYDIDTRTLTGKRYN
ncbi:hypothetical protein [Chitinophaga pinensis]|uniref:Uncharacterized protein n=1 Tax=Chitinophaga pinensis TaxID=79329 RepID=A0A5C6LMK6_9BACT|nr:hypothetical protein [Chitinophaga pinensis]TWV96218.1 hypothetical protein FEF09_23855 [Chitinophaga pinensis]